MTAASSVKLARATDDQPSLRKGPPRGGPTRSPSFHNAKNATRSEWPQVSLIAFPRFGPFSRSGFRSLLLPGIRCLELGTSLELRVWSLEFSHGGLIYDTRNRQKKRRPEPLHGLPRLFLAYHSARNESHSEKSPPASNRLPEFKRFSGRKQIAEWIGKSGMTPWPPLLES